MRTRRYTPSTQAITAAGRGRGGGFLTRPVLAGAEVNDLTTATRGPTGGHYNMERLRCHQDPATVV
jgi:hypothetical protein